MTSGSEARSTRAVAVLETMSQRILSVLPSGKVKVGVRRPCPSELLVRIDPVVSDAAVVTLHIGPSAIDMEVGEETTVELPDDVRGQLTGCDVGEAAATLLDAVARGNFVEDVWLVGNAPYYIRSTFRTRSGCVVVHRTDLAKALMRLFRAGRRTTCEYAPYVD